MALNVSEIIKSPGKFVKQKGENFVYGVINKYGYSPFGRSTYGRVQETRPPYEREVSPFWLKNVAESHSLINNSIEEKVHQAFRRGFTEWEKRYEAKCPNCDEEFKTLEPFLEQLGEDDADSKVISSDDVDFSVQRPCPNCGEMAMMETPDSSDRKRAEDFFEEANMSEKATELSPDIHNSIGQTFLEICKSVAYDIQTFDDGWMIFEREYILDENGEVVDWELKDVFRAPPYLMRYSVDDQDGKIGQEHWVCLECRAKDPEDYDAQNHPGECEHCGNRTYECFAYAIKEPRGGGSHGTDPIRYYVRGEFAHGSEYKPSFLYGLSPIFSVWTEARALEKMDEWYREAYEQRRAPRGAIVVRSTNAESVRSWNTEQMEKLNHDANHIPTFIDDTDGKGEPLTWQPLLEEPAAMQHMQMREWFLDRISAKFGVTAVFQTGGAESSGMSQSLEIVVANRSTERLQNVFEDVFIPAVVGQLQVSGWTIGLESPEEEDEQAEAQRVGTELQNAQVAQQLGADVEWTREDRADIKPGMLEAEEGGEGLMGALGGGGGEGDPTPMEGEPGGQTTPEGGRPDEANEMGGEPDDPDEPTTDDPIKLSDSGGDGGGNGGAAVGSVESGEPSAGYSNATYSGTGNNEDVLDYLEHVEQQLDESNAANKDDVVDEACKIYERDVDGVPSASQLKKYARNPGKSFGNVKRYGSGEWRQDDTKIKLVKTMYKVLTNG